MAWTAPQRRHWGAEEAHCLVNLDDTPSGPCHGRCRGRGGGVAAPACMDLHYLTPAKRIRSVLVTSVNTHRQEQERMKQMQ